MSRRADVERKAMLDRLTKLRMDQNVSKSDDESDCEIDLATLIHNKCGDGVFDPSSRHSNLEAFQYARSRGRRKSKEFEDLLMHTATGSLRLSRQAVFVRPKTSSSRRHFESLPIPDTKHTHVTTSEKSVTPKPKRPFQRSKSDLGDRFVSRDRQTKSTDVIVRGQSPTPGTRKGHPVKPGSPTGRAGTPGSPSNKRLIKEKHSKSSGASPKLSHSKHQVVK